MKRPKLQDISTESLVQEFVALGVQQDIAHLENDVAEVTRLYWAIGAIKDELKSRPGDQRLALLRLLDHPNLQVQLNTAKATLAIAPHAARQQLEMVKASKIQPQAGEAGMSIWSLDQGIFKPN